MLEEDSKKDPTHHSELDPKTMKVIELRRELEARNLNSKGLKSQLVARLAKTLKTEAEKEEEEAENRSETPADAHSAEDEKLEANDRDEDRKKSEEEERKLKEEKEKQALERRYILPENPCIIVHPSRTAKGGKFDCTVMSLSVLLDYRQEDNKEHSFEVSLFAELFNEMMMRDFGFRIYCALVETPEKKEEDKEKEKKKDKKDDKERKDDKEKKEDKKDDKEDKKDKKEDKKKKEEKEDDKDIDDDDREDESDDDELDETVKDSGNSQTEFDERREKDRRKDDKDKKKDKEKKKDKGKMITHDPGLLLSFVYFDQNHCGYLFEKDIEEILYTLGLNLSRAQVRKLLQKVITRDTFNYRKLTDKPRIKDVDEDKSSSSESKMDTEDKHTLKWNKHLLPIFKMEKNIAIKPTPVDDDKSENVSGMVLYKGALVDIDKLLLQLQRSEKARADTEQKLKDTQEELDEIKEISAVNEQSSQKTSQELKECKKRLSLSEDQLKKVQTKARRYLDVAQICRDKLQALTDDSDTEPIINSGKVESSQNGVTSNMETEESKPIVKSEPVENGET